MRRLAAIAVLAAALAPVAAPQASAAPGIVTPRTHALTCKIGFGADNNLFRLGNTTTQTIPRGTKISVMLVYDRPVKIAKPYAVVITRNVQPHTAQVVRPLPAGVKSCSATVQLPPDVTRR